MSKPRYRYAHQQQRARIKRAVDAGQALCVEPVCLMSTRWIQPGTPWDLCHDPSGTVVTGPGHAKCNRSEGATRGNRRRKYSVRRWAL